MRLAPLVAAALVAFVAPAAAQDAPSLAEVLAADFRADDAPRDQYRNPSETLAFFRIEPAMRVVEYGPGGGWYTRVLAPWIAPTGTYMALNADSGPMPTAQGSEISRAMSWAERFPTQAAAQTGVDAAQIIAFESDEIPDDIVGTADRILVFRSLHGMLNSNTADRELRAMRTLLADDGMIGVVQHRAPEDASYADSNGSRGYLRQSDVIKLFELNGFELADSSEVNANPADPADWPAGVWTLPPSLSGGDADRERLLAIGESDRMTLLFRKRG